MIKTAVFPVGGLGTRFLPATKSMPKEMMPVFNKPIIQHAFEEAKAAGIEKFIFITGRNKNIINNHFDNAYELESKLSKSKKDFALQEVKEWLPTEPGSITFIRQGSPLGLGHSIWCARNFIKNEPFIVILADEMVLEKKKANLLKNMIQLHKKKGANSSIISVAQVEKKDVNKYGIISFKGDKITTMIEKPSPINASSNLAISGRYILQPEIFSYLEKQKTGTNNEIQLTDAMNNMIASHPFYYQQYNEKRFDCGNNLGYIEANIAFALEDTKTGASTLKMIKKYSNDKNQ